MSTPHIAKPYIANPPILYSFRRCPYAMRARMALDYAGFYPDKIEHREILLKNKPDAMLAASEKGTVPVLVLPDNSVIDESRDIMMWALASSDSDHWYHHLDESRQARIEAWIDRCDNAFKPWLDRYKYHVGYPEQSQESYRQQCEVFLSALEKTLSQSPYLLGEQTSLADIALFPFIRQCAFVDKAWFDGSEYDSLKSWLNGFLKSERFTRIMTKYPVWAPPDSSAV